MKVKFNGLIEKRTKGCGVCGARNVEMQFTVTKTYILPSGRTVTFRAGRTEEVNPSDGAFLLGYKYTNPDGSVHPVFEEVV